MANAMSIWLWAILSQAAPATSNSLAINEFFPPAKDFAAEWPMDTEENCNIVISTREQTPKLVLNTGGPQSTVRSLAFSPDSTRLYSGGLDKVVQVWGFQADERSIRRAGGNRALLVQNLRWEIERGPNGAIYALAASPADRRLAIGGFNTRVTPHGPGGDIVIYDTTTAEVDRFLQGHGAPVVALDFSPSGKRLVSAARNGEVILWEESRRWEATRIRDAVEFDGVFTPVKFLTEHLIVMPVRQGRSAQWQLALVDANSPNTAPRILEQPHFASVITIAVDFANKRWATADIGDKRPNATAEDQKRRGTVYIWEGFENPTVKVLRHGRMALAMDFDPVGRLFVATALYPYADGTRQSVLEMWDTLGGKMLDEVETSRRDPTHVCRVSPDGSRVATFAGHDSELRIFMLKDRQGQLIDKPLQKAPLRLRGRGRGMLKVAFSNEPGYQIGYGTQAAKEPAVNELASIAHGFDAQTMMPLSAEQTAQTTWRSPSQVAGGWSASIEKGGERVAIKKGGELWTSIDLQHDVEGLASTFTFVSKRPDQPPYAIALGTSVADGVYIYSLRGREEPCRLLRYFRDHAGMVTSLSVSSDGKYLASAAIDQTIKIWSLEGLETLETKFTNQSAWGATFLFENDAIVVRNILESGTAARKGLRDGDVIIEAVFTPPVMTKLNLAPSDTATDPRAILRGLEETRPLPIDAAILTLKRRGSVLNRKVLLVVAWSPVMTFFADSDGSWAAFTPQGYYDASVDGDELFGWQLNRGQSQKPDFFRADQFRGQLEKPEVMKQLLASGSIQQALRQADELPPDAENAVLNAARKTPRVRILSPRDAEMLDANKVMLAASVEYPDIETAQAHGGVAYVNGVPGTVVNQSDNELQRTYQWSADVYDSYNRLRVVTQAGDTDSTAYADVHFRLRGSGERRKPKLHLFLVAAGAYEHVAKLAFPLDDAKAIEQSFKETTRELYELGQVVPLFNEVVTREGVTKAIENWKSSLAEARSDDLLVVFVAGHGLAVDGKYYFVPVSVDKPESVAEVGIGWDVFNQLAELRCKKLVLLDTCHSGNVAPATGVEQLKNAIRPLKQSDMLVLAATDVGQEALEIAALGHGVFTQSLLDGFAGAADRQKDEQIYLHEMAEYVEEEVPRRTKSLQLQTPRRYPSELFDVISLPLATLR